MLTIFPAEYKDIEHETIRFLDRMSTLMHEEQLQLIDGHDMRNLSKAVRLELILRIQKNIDQNRREMIRADRAMNRT